MDGKTYNPGQCVHDVRDSSGLFHDQTKNKLRLTMPQLVTEQ